LLTSYLGRRSNAPILARASKSFSFVLHLKLVANKLLDKPLGIDNKNLLPYGYK